MESEGGLVVGGLADGGPADKAGVQPGDRILGVGDEDVTRSGRPLAQVWSAGAAGAPVLLRIGRDEGPIAVRIMSADRASFLRAPRLH